MNFYRLIDTSTSTTGTVLQNYGTRDEAHEAARDYSKARWADFRIELIDVPTDKAAICNILNNEGGLNTVPVLRTFKLTPRGGLAECANGE